MRLVLKASKARLLSWTDAGYVTLNDNGVAVLRLPDKKPRYVTDVMDELEYYRLVYVDDERFWRLTDEGSAKLQEYYLAYPIAMTDGR